MKVTMIAGSNRRNATSTQMLSYMAALLNSQGVSVQLIDLSELQLPLFSPDNWDFHPNVRKMLEAIAGGDGLILATPEYHGSLSGALKNALDYVSADLVTGKPVLSVSSAGGALGVSSLLQLQAIVRNLHGINCPDWISISSAPDLFAPDGSPLDEGMKERVQAAVNQLIEMTGRLVISAKASFN